jgi:hypothetical protein
MAANAGIGPKDIFESARQPGGDVWICFSGYDEGVAPALQGVANASNPATGEGHSLLED